MGEKEIFRELMDSGHKFVWYFREPGVSNPDGNSPDIQVIVDLNGKELARRIDVPETPENGWRIDSWHARDFGACRKVLWKWICISYQLGIFSGKRGPCFRSPCYVCAGRIAHNGGRDFFFIKIL